MVHQWLGRAAMGHIHLGVLPSSKSWRGVVELLSDGNPSEQVLRMSAVAVENELRAAAEDAIFVESLVLLGSVPLAANSVDFADALRKLDITIREKPGLLELTTALGKALDARVQQTGSRTDFGELCRRSLLATITTNIGDSLPGLFDATAEDVRVAAAKFSKPNAFSGLARSFFTRLLSDTISSYLDRTLALHVGGDDRFENVVDRSAFDDTVSQYSMEATRIIKEFAGGWYGKTVYSEGGITRASAARFGAVAFKKTVEEMQRKRARNV